MLEKEPEMSPKVLRLESGGWKVIRYNWSKHITEALRTGTVNVLYRNTTSCSPSLWCSILNILSYMNIQSFIPLG